MLTASATIWTQSRGACRSSTRLTSASNSSAYLSASVTVDENSFDQRMSQQKVALFILRSWPITERHNNRWRQRHTKVTGQQMVVGETDWLHRHCKDQLLASPSCEKIRTLPLTYVGTLTLLALVVQAEQVDGLTVELLNVVAWHDEVAKYDKHAVEQHELVEEVWGLIDERRRDGFRRSVDTDDDDYLSLRRGLQLRFDCDSITVRQHFDHATTIGLPK